MHSRRDICCQNQLFAKSNETPDDNTTSQFPSSTHSELVHITWCPCHFALLAIILNQNQGADFGKLQLIHDTAIAAPRLQIHFQLSHTMTNDKAFDPWQTIMNATHSFEERLNRKLYAKAENNRTASVLIPKTWLQIAHCEQMLVWSTMHTHIWMNSLGADGQTMRWTIQNSISQQTKQHKNITHIKKQTNDNKQIKQIKNEKK